METERNQGVLSPLLHSQGSCNLENMGLPQLSKYPHNRELLPHPALQSLGLGSPSTDTLMILQVHAPELRP